MNYPQPKHGLHYETPAQTWDEGMPLGNGLLGALVWGDGQPLNISLDRTDAWDCRPVTEFDDPECTYRTMRAWHEAGRHEDLVRMFEAPYERPAPTKIPVGRIELTVDGAGPFASTDLDLLRAAATVRFDDSTRLEVTVHATLPVGWIEMSSAHAITPRLVAPPFAGLNESASGFNAQTMGMGDLRQLHYPAPDESSGPGWLAYSQQGWGEFRFAVYLAWTQKDRLTWRAAWSIATSRDGKIPLEIARDRARAALECDAASLAEGHLAWWRAYWEKSSLRLPNAAIERQWYLDQYKFGAATRRGVPPLTLQGPWTADNGEIPPWKGDYHNDLNTQLSYWPCYGANHLEEGLNYLDWLWDTGENCRQWTRRFFELDGLNVPGVADIENRPLGGWRQYTFSCTTSCWLAHHFYLHWRYSQDRDFLRQRAYPYLRDCAVFIEAVSAERDTAGLRTLALSASPEMYDNSPQAWFERITNYDLALMRWLLTATAVLASELGLTEEAAHWDAIVEELPQLAQGEYGELLVAPGHPLDRSHRHLSHMMAIHPLGLLKREDGEEAQRAIEATLERHEKMGVGDWCGYTYAWLASHRARLGDGERAERALEIFSRAFTLRSSLHCNGDQTGEGYSGYDYRPMTLEGNFAAAAATQEMLLQSHAGFIRVFPALPASWSDAAFTDFRAEGAFLVSAELLDGQLHRLTIRAEKAGACRIHSDIDGREFQRDLAAGEVWTIL